MVYIGISIGCLLAVLLLWLFFRARGQPFSKKEVEVLLVIEFIGLLVTGKEYYENVLYFDGSLVRPAYGEGTEEQELIYKTEEFQGRLTTEISEEVLSEEEIRELLEEAKLEIDVSFPGENESLMNVTGKLSPKTSYQDGRVRAEWYIGDNTIVDFYGNLLVSIEEETFLDAEAILECQGTKEIYEIPIRLVPLNLSTEEGLRQKILLTLEEIDQEKGDYVLPEEVEGVSVIWSNPMDNGGVLLCGLGVLTACGLIFSRKEEKRRKQKKYQEKLQNEYPRILNMLSLYVSSGIAIRQAIRRMTLDYEARKKRGGEHRAGMELLVLCVHEMEAGMGEMQAYRRLGERSQNRRYRKLSLLLVQDLEKGTGMLASQLEQESMEVYEEEKNRIRAEGEKLSTKLLLPMMGLLGVVLILMVYPAMSGVGM